MFKEQTQTQSCCSKIQTQTWLKPLIPPSVHFKKTKTMSLSLPISKCISTVHCVAGPKIKSNLSSHIPTTTLSIQKLIKAIVSYRWDKSTTIENISHIELENIQKPNHQNLTSKTCRTRKKHQKESRRGNKTHLTPPNIPNINSMMQCHRILK